MLTIDAAAHVQIGDIMTDSNGNSLSIIDVQKTVLGALYTLETYEGTVLASGLFVTTLCNEAVYGGERFFGTTLADWQSGHHHHLAGDF